MVYSDDTGRRIRLRIKRSPGTSGEVADDAVTRMILEVADRYPRFTPVEVHAQLRSQGHRDVTVQTVRAVMQR